MCDIAFSQIVFNKDLSIYLTATATLQFTRLLKTHPFTLGWSRTVYCSGASDSVLADELWRCYTVCLKKTSPTFLAVTWESIVGFS